MLSIFCTIKLKTNWAKISTLLDKPGQTKAPVVKCSLSIIVPRCNIFIKTLCYLVQLAVVAKHTIGLLIDNGQEIVDSG